MGREAFALIQNTGCVDHLALITATGTSRRVIATHGWSDAEALAAIKVARPDDLMDVASIATRPGSSSRARRPRSTTAAASPHLQAGGHRGRPGAIPSRRKAARRPLADRVPRGPSREHLGLRTGGRAPDHRPPHRQPAAARPAHRRDRHRQGDARPRYSSRLQPRRSDHGAVQLQRGAARHGQSQLFGYRRGAFTGADSSFPGVIRAAAGGTLFLDEIADVPVDVQPKLLRFLEHHEIDPLGEPQPIKVDVRIIAATNGNLDQLVAQGRFREDLYYRLNGVHLKLPPLRERREEIPTLLQHYIQRYGDEQKKGRLTLSDETLEYLLLYSWPGNIRQLANEVRRMVALSETDATLTPALLSTEIQASRKTIPASMAAEAEIRLGLDQPLPTAVDLLEQTLVRHALERTHGRVEEAAKLLGISRKGLFLKRRRWGFQQAS